MANTLITPSLIAQKALFHLENHTVMAGLSHRDYKSEFKGGQGDTVTIRKPVKFVVSDGATRVNQDATETSTSIVIDKRKHVSFEFTSEEYTLDVEDFTDRYIKPAAIALANQVDVDLFTTAQENFFNVVGVAGTNPSAFSDLTAVAKRLDRLAVPDDGYRNLIVDTDARWDVAATLGAAGASSVYDSGIVGPMVRRGYLGQLAGLRIHGDQNVQVWTAGARPRSAGGVGNVNGTLTNGASSVAFDGAGSSTAQYLRKGDVITFAGVNAVNPVAPYADDGRLAEFVVTEDVTTSGSAGTIPIYPAINDGSGANSQNPALKTCTAIPADNAAISVVLGATNGADADTGYKQHIAFHKNALALVMVPLDMPRSVVEKARMDWNNMSIRVIMDYDSTNDKEICRLDILYGVKAIYPELGVRLMGA